MDTATILELTAADWVPLHPVECPSYSIIESILKELEDEKGLH